MPRNALGVEGSDHVWWFQSSNKVRRGFCGTCGAALFWDPIHRDWAAIAMGVFDDAVGTSLSMHTFVSEKGDCYKILDSQPQNDA